MRIANYLEQTGTLFSRFGQFLEDAPAEHVALLSEVLHAYSDHPLDRQGDTEQFEGILLEAASIYADYRLAGHTERPNGAEACSGVFYQEPERFGFALAALRFARTGGIEEVSRAHETLLQLVGTERQRPTLPVKKVSNSKRRQRRAA